MKTWMKIMVFACVALLINNTATAQCSGKSQSWAVKAANSNNCVNVNYDENQGNITMTMSFPREKTDALKKYLEKELGKNYTTHTGGLQRWTKLGKTKTDDFKTSISNGYLKISYTGDDEDILEEVKALVREVKHQVCEEEKK